MYADKEIRIIKIKNNMKVRIKLSDEKCMPKKHGDWFDLASAEHVFFKRPSANTLRRVRTNGDDERTRDVEFDVQKISLGVAMELPEGYEAVVLPRSSTYSKYGVILTNSQGVIDNKYKGDNDIWQAMFLAVKDGEIEVGDRVAQFKIQLSQHATMWQKIKWLFDSTIEFEVVDNLGNQDRGGFGSTGVK